MLAPMLSQIISPKFRIHTNTCSSAPSDSQPVLADEVQTFKALITIHKVLQEGHPIALKEAMANRGWIELLGRGSEGMRGYAPLIHEYVRYLLAKLAFHQQHPNFNGTFEYEEYLSLKLINDPNEGYEVISDLMSLQDRIDSFQKLIFAHFRHSANECRISALVPLVQESYGLYKFITSMLRAMHQCKSGSVLFCDCRKALADTCFSPRHSHRR